MPQTRWIQSQVDRERVIAAWQKYEKDPATHNLVAYLDLTEQIWAKQNPHEVCPWSQDLAQGSVVTYITRCVTDYQIQAA
ncbi:MAG: hypothetical protein ACM37W_23305 [Actinomycetota bacterium]